MAKSLTSRFGLQRWTADSDTQSRAEFDAGHAQVELLAGIMRQGLAAARGSATVWARSVYYSTDTRAWDYSDGAVWAPAGDPRNPRGKVAGGEATVTQTVGVVADLAGLTGTFTAVAGRRYRVAAKIEAHQSTAGDVWILALLDGATQLQRAVLISTAGVQNVSLGYSNFSSINGAKTWRLQLSRQSGSGSCDSECDALRPAQLLIDDDGLL